MLIREETPALETQEAAGEGKGEGEGEGEGERRGGGSTLDGDSTKEEKKRKRKKKKKKRDGDDSNSTIIYYWSYPAWYQRRLRPIRRTAIFSVTNIIEYRDIVGEWFPSKSEKRARTVSYRLTKIIIPTDRLRDTIGIEYAWRFYFREEC